jgi:hypothetical protein
MDIKMMMIGIIMGVIVAITGISIVLDAGTHYDADTTSMQQTFSSLQNQSVYVKNDMNATAQAMNDMFGNTSAQQQSTTGWSELDALYRSAGGVARLSIHSIGYITVILSSIFANLSFLTDYLMYGIVAFIIALIISIAYLVFFRIPR